MHTSPVLIDQCNPIQQQLPGALARPNTNGGYHTFDEGAQLIKLFEGKSFQETLITTDKTYIRATQT